MCLVVTGWQVTSNCSEFVLYCSKFSVLLHIYSVKRFTHLNVISRFSQFEIPWWTKKVVPESTRFDLCNSKVFAFYHAYFVENVLTLFSKNVLQRVVLLFLLGFFIYFTTHGTKKQCLHFVVPRLPTFPPYCTQHTVTFPVELHQFAPMYCLLF